MLSPSYILQIRLWHQSEQKNPTDLRVKTWGGGGDKRHVIPPCQNMVDILPPSPQDLRPFLSTTQR